MQLTFSTIFTLASLLAANVANAVPNVRPPGPKCNVQLKVEWNFVEGDNDFIHATSSEVRIFQVNDPSYSLLRVTPWLGATNFNPFTVPLTETYHDVVINAGWSPTASAATYNAEIQYAYMTIEGRNVSYNMLNYADENVSCSLAPFGPPAARALAATCTLYCTSFNKLR